MVGSAEILAAFRELSNSKQLDRSELHGLLQDGIHAALAKKHGANVQAEVEINEDKGTIRIVLLKTVVEEVTDSSREMLLEEARFEDPEFQVGDVMEIPVDFNFREGLDGGPSFPGLTLTLIDRPQWVLYPPMSVQALADGDQLNLWVVARDSCYSVASIEKMLNLYLDTLTRIVGRPNLRLKDWGFSS